MTTCVGYDPAAFTAEMTRLMHMDGLRFARWLYRRGIIGEACETGPMPIADHVDGWLREIQSRGQAEADALPF